MVTILSNIQIIGLILGLVCLLIVVVRLQRSINDQLNIMLLIPTGIVLLSISIFPELVIIAADIISISEFPGWRLVTLNIMAVIIIWFLLIYQITSSSNISHELGELQIALTVQEFCQKFGDFLPNDTILLVIPALNEAENLKYVLPSIPSKVADHNLKVLVVDDGSSDDTVAVALDHNCFVASHLSRYGGGTAVRTGYRIGDLLK